MFALCTPWKTKRLSCRIGGRGRKGAMRGSSVTVCKSESSRSRLPIHGRVFNWVHELENPASVWFFKDFRVIKQNTNFNNKKKNGTNFTSIAVLKKQKHYITVVWIFFKKKIRFFANINHWFRKNQPTIAVQCFILSNLFFLTFYKKIKRRIIVITWMFLKHVFRQVVYRLTTTPQELSYIYREKRVFSKVRQMKFKADITYDGVNLFSRIITGVQ